MRGTKAPVIPIALHKQLLVMECEVNRAQLRQDWRGLKQEMAGLRTRASAAGMMAGKAALLGIAGYLSARMLRSGGRGHAGRHFQDRPARAGGSWWPVIVNGARLGMAAWKLFRR